MFLLVIVLELGEMSRFFGRFIFQPLKMIMIIEMVVFGHNQS